MAPNPRIAKAFAAMKDLGISEATVKPVLKNLLKLYDKNWELIEEENYRALADAIFEYAESKDAEEKERRETITNESEPPLKRLRRQQGGQASTSGCNSSPVLGEGSRTRAKLEENDGSETCYTQERTEPMQFGDKRVESEPISSIKHLKNTGKESASTQTFPVQEASGPLEICRRDEKTDSDSTLPSSRAPERQKGKESVSPETGPIENRSSSILRDKGKEPVSPQIALRDKRSPSGKPSHTICLKEPKIEPGIVLLPREKVPNQRNNAFIKPKSEDFTDDLPQFEVPIAMIHPLPGPPRNEGPVSMKASLSRNVSAAEANGQRTQASQSVDGGDEGDHTSGNACKTGKEHELVVNPEDSSASFEIASSPLGEVKISLSCDSALGQSGFHVPSLDEVLKMVEDRCLKSYRIVEPNFSVMTLMKELCHCFLELGNDSMDDKAEDRRNTTSNLVSLGNTNMKNALGAEENVQSNCNVSLGSSNGSSNFKVLVPQVSRLLAMDGLDSLDPITRLNQKVVENSYTERDKKKKEPQPQNRGNSGSLVVVQQRRFGDMWPAHDVNDISKGEERVRISVVNEFGGEQYPPLFYYIPQNIVYQSGYVKFSLARIGDEDCCASCFGDCLSSSIPCACARETGGEFAYTLEGRVKERFLEECISMNHDPDGHPQRVYCKNCPLERSKNDELADPCKGHLVRKFIKECWSKCGCNKQCGNRIVQRGITCNLQVFMTTETKGWGLRTLEDLPKGTFVCEYVGEVVTNTELYERNIRNSRKEKHTYPVLLDADWGSEGVLNDEEALCLDATFYGNVARFVNHRCSDANMVEIPVEVETPDHHYYHLAFFTTRDIDALEELTWTWYESQDYGIDFDDHNHPVKAFRCRCGSKFCRDMKRSNRGKSVTLR